MVTLTTGINRIRTLLNTDIYKGQAGTGTTAVTTADTGLETADATTLDTVSTQLADKAIQVTFTIDAVTGEGTAYSEQEIQLNSGSTGFNRIVHTPVTKNANEEFNYITNIFIRGNEN